MFSKELIVDWWKLLATGMRKQHNGHLGHFSNSDQLNVVIFTIDHPTLGGKPMLEFLPPTKIEVTTRKGPFQKTVSFSNHWFFKGYGNFQGSKSRYIRSSVLPSNFINSISSLDFWRVTFVYSPFFMTYREIWTICLWRDRLRRAMVFKQLRIWELATARNRRPRDFFPAVEVPIPRGVVKGENQEQSRGKMQCHYVLGWYSQKTKSSLISCFCSRAYGESIFQMSSLLSTPHTEWDGRVMTLSFTCIGPVQHNSNWAVWVEQQGEGPIPKVSNKRWGIFFALSFFQRQDTAFSQCLHVFSPWLSDWLPHLQSLMNSGNTKRIWYWRSYHVKVKLRARTNICQLIAKKTPNFLATWLLFPP